MPAWWCHVQILLLLRCVVCGVWCELDIYENLVFLFVLKSKLKYFPREDTVVIAFSYLAQG